MSVENSGRQKLSEFLASHRGPPRNPHNPPPSSKSRSKYESIGKEKKEERKPPTEAELQAMAKVAARLSHELEMTAEHDRARFRELQNPEKRRQLAEIAQRARERRASAPVETQTGTPA